MVRSNLQKKRLNLVVPSINPEHRFGGIETAFRLFEELAREYDCTRIIVVDAAPSPESLRSLPDYEIVPPYQHSDAQRQIAVAIGAGPEADLLPIAEHDVFVATIWYTSILIQQFIKWQNDNFGQFDRKYVYLIQDFECGFYPWSSRYLLANSTYFNEPKTIAVFNSRLLYDYFKSQGFRFEAEFVFDAQIHPKLVAKRGALGSSLKKKKQILIYGRPSTPRNAFEVIVEGLRIWAKTFPNAAEWKVISLGEKHQDVDLGNGLRMQSLGKAAIEQYAEFLADSSVGISLMVSPHPSYPPLEMNYFGVRTVTNSFANKDLSKNYPWITSLRILNHETVAAAVRAACAGAEEEGLIAKLRSDDSSAGAPSIPEFPFIAEILSELGIRPASRSDGSLARTSANALP